MAIHPPKTKLPKRPSYLSKYHGLRMTEEEYLALPEEKPYLEYVEGIVLQKAMPNDEHSDLVVKLILALSEFASRFGGRVRTEMRARFGDTPSYRLPDVSYYLPGVPSGEDAVPSVGIEVRSPGQTVAELRSKCRFYLDFGVSECWLVEPRSRTVEVFDASRDGIVLAADAVLESLLLPGFSLPLPDLFAVLDR